MDGFTWLDRFLGERGVKRDEPYRWDRLATYNAERERGLVHTPEYRAMMAVEQAAFDAETAARRTRREVDEDRKAMLARGPGA